MSELLQVGITVYSSVPCVFSTNIYQTTTTSIGRDSSYNTAGEMQLYATY